MAAAPNRIPPMSKAGLGGLGVGRGRLAGIGVSAVLVLLAVALAVTGGSGGGGSEPQPSAVRFVEVADLTGLEADLGHPIYWAGEQPSTQLELREEADGSIYLRYLPPGVTAGDPE